MINDVKEHWGEVVEIRKQLLEDYKPTPENPDGAVYLMSMRNRKMRTVEGRLTVATPHIAALMIVQNTHREATPEEIAKWRKEQAARSGALIAEKDKKENRLTPELIGAAVGQAVQATLNAVQAPAAPAQAVPAALAPDTSFLEPAPTEEAEADPFERASND